MGRWRTRANAVTSLRLLLAPLLVLAILREAWPWACLLLALAVVSDLADGYVARRFVEVSPLGGLVDHGVDAIFVASGTLALAWLGALPMLLPGLILVAFAQYALDSRVGANRALRPSALGRFNGIAYFGILALSLLSAGVSLPGPADTTLWWLGWLLVSTTLLSMGDRALASFRARRGPVGNQS
ncbi:CDP-alcohol phosphatidyltransferase family protein [Myxococcota bacterium]|nr:CDP-alcohol phosphatidyltransferase family protein [Myxococcota bacterium]